MFGSDLLTSNLNSPAVSACRPCLRGRGVSRSGQLAAVLILSQLGLMAGCGSFSVPSAGGLDLMNPSSSFLFPGSNKHSSPYQMMDGTPAGGESLGDGSLTEEAYQKIRQAKSQNSIVLQVAGDEQAVRLLPLPPTEKSVFVSELLSQTGVLKKFGKAEVTLYRQSPESIAGVKMEVKFQDNGTIDPACDYGLRPGDRVHVRRKTSSTVESLVKMALRR